MALSVMWLINEDKNLSREILLQPPWSNPCVANSSSPSMLTCIFSFSFVLFLPRLNNKLDFLTFRVSLLAFSQLATFSWATLRSFFSDKSC